MEQRTWNNIIVKKADELARLVYRLTKVFPKEEMFGLTNQLRRAALSVPLNIIEGYARSTSKSYKQFLAIAYGSLKETKYLLYFAFNEGYLKEDDYRQAISLAEEVGKLTWSVKEKMKAKTGGTEQKAENKK